MILVVFSNWHDSMILSFPLFYCILFKLIPSWKTFLQECRNQHWPPLPCDSRFQGQIFIGDVEAGYMLQCKPLYFHFSVSSGAKHVWVISWQFPYSQSTQTPQFWKVTTFFLDLLPFENSLFPFINYFFPSFLLHTQKFPDLKCSPRQHLCNNCSNIQLQQLFKLYYLGSTHQLLLQN